MNILIPIDFTTASMHAFAYALKLAENVAVNLTVLHVCTENDLYPIDLREARIEAGKKKLIRMTRNYPNQKGVDVDTYQPVNRVVKTGRAIQEIVNICYEESIDMIIMGTKAKHHLSDYLFGSVSTNLIKKAPCSIVIVPEESPIQSISRIALATKLESVNQAPFDYVLELAKRLNASMEQVHIYPLKLNEEENKEMTIDHYGSVNADNQQLTIVRDLVVQKGLEYFTKYHQIDLLALYVPHKKSWWENIKRNFNKRLVYSFKVPLLILNEQVL